MNDSSEHAAAEQPAGTATDTKGAWHAPALTELGNAAALTATGGKGAPDDPSHSALS